MRKSGFLTLSYFILYPLPSGMVSESRHRTSRARLPQMGNEVNKSFTHTRPHITTAAPINGGNIRPIRFDLDRPLHRSDAGPCKLPFLFAANIMPFVITNNYHQVCALREIRSRANPVADNELRVKGLANDFAIPAATNQEVIDSRGWEQATSPDRILCHLRFYSCCTGNTCAGTICGLTPRLLFEPGAGSPAQHPLQAQSHRCLAPSPDVVEVHMAMKYQ